MTNILTKDQVNHFFNCMQKGSKFNCHRSLALHFKRSSSSRTD